MRGYLRCMGQDVRDWDGDTPAEFFVGCMDALTWVLQWNRADFGGTYVVVEVVADVGGETVSLCKVGLLNATADDFADYIEQVVAALFRVCDLVGG